MSAALVSCNRGGVGNVNDRPADWELPQRTALEPQAAGRGLPLPPLLPLVAVAGILFGLALGYGSAQKPGPSAAYSPALASSRLTSSPPPIEPDASSFPTLTSPTASPAEVPPAGGLSLAQALVALQNSGMTVSPSAIISARVTRLGQVEAYASVPVEWVWEFVVQGYFPSLGDGIRFCDASPIPRYVPAVSPELCPPSDVTVPAATTETIVLDYFTGAFVVGISPAPGY